MELGDGEVAEEDDYVRFAYEVKNENDSMLYSSRMLVHLIKAVKNGNLEEGLLMMKCQEFRTQLANKDEVVKKINNAIK